MKSYKSDCSIICIREERINVPIISMVLFPTLFSGIVVCSKHSTSMPLSAGSALVLSVDMKEVAVVPGPNPAPGVAVKALLNGPFGPQLEVPVDECASTHSLLPPPTLHRVIPLLSPVVLQVKVKVSPGQVGGAAMNCASPEWSDYNVSEAPFIFSYSVHMYKVVSLPDH